MATYTHKTSHSGYTSVSEPIVVSTGDHITHDVGLAARGGGAGLVGLFLSSDGYILEPNSEIDPSGSLVGSTGAWRLFEVSGLVVQPLFQCSVCGSQEQGYCEGVNLISSPSVEAGEPGTSGSVQAPGWDVALAASWSVPAGSVTTKDGIIDAVYSGSLSLIGPIGDEELVPYPIEKYQHDYTITKSGNVYLGSILLHTARESERTYGSSEWGEVQDTGQVGTKYRWAEPSEGADPKFYMQTVKSTTYLSFTSDTSTVLCGGVLLSSRTHETGFSTNVYDSNDDSDENGEWVTLSYSNVFEGHFIGMGQLQIPGTVESDSVSALSPVTSDGCALIIVRDENYGFSALYGWYNETLTDLTSLVAGTNFAGVDAASLRATADYPSAPRMMSAFTIDPQPTLTLPVFQSTTASGVPILAILPETEAVIVYTGRNEDTLVLDGGSSLYKAIGSETNQAIFYSQEVSRAPASSPPVAPVTDNQAYPWGWTSFTSSTTAYGDESNLRVYRSLTDEEFAAYLTAPETITAYGVRYSRGSVTADPMMIEYVQTTEGS